MGLGGIEGAKGSICGLAAANGATFFQLEITDVVQLVRAMHRLRVVAVVNHRFQNSFKFEGEGQPLPFTLATSTVS